MSPERLLLGFVHDAHPTTANFAKNAIVSQPIELLAPRRAGDSRWTFPLLSADRPRVFHHDECGKQVADAVSQLGVSRDVFGEGRPLTAAVTRDELFGQGVERMTITANIRVFHVTHYP